VSDDVLLRATDVVKSFASRRRVKGIRSLNTAVNGVSLEVKRARLSVCRGVGVRKIHVGSLPRSLLRSPRPRRVQWRGTDDAVASPAPPHRREMQLVFQDPTRRSSRERWRYRRRSMRINKIAVTPRSTPRARTVQTVGLDPRRCGAIRTSFPVASASASASRVRSR